MSDFVTAKDELASLLENGLTGLGVPEANDISILLVQSMEQANLLPTEREYRIGSPDALGADFEFGTDQSGPKGEEVYAEPPPLGEGEYLLQRLVTPWMGGLA